MNPAYFVITVLALAAWGLIDLGRRLGGELADRMKWLRFRLPEGRHALSLFDKGFVEHIPTGRIGFVIGGDVNYRWRGGWKILVTVSFARGPRENIPSRELRPAPQSDAQAYLRGHT